MFRLQGEQARKLGKINETQWKKGEFEYHQTQLVGFLYFVDIFGIINMFRNDLSLNALLIEENFSILIEYFLFVFSYWRVLLAWLAIVNCMFIIPLC